MKKIIPAKIFPGNTIGIIAPSSSFKTTPLAIQKKLATSLEKALETTVVFGPHVREANAQDSSPIESRISDLHAAFKDPSINAILCVRGGFHVNQILDHIDWDLIQKNPKVICGYSDNTVLLNAIYAKTGLVTYSGPNLSTLGKYDPEYILEYFKKCTADSKPFNIAPSNKWNSGISGDEQILKSKKYVVIEEGIAEGTSLGGNLSSMAILQGTQYRPSLKNSILFLEEVDMFGENFAAMFDRNLQSMLQLPDAKDIKGVVIGRFQQKTGMTMKKLLEILASKNIPKNIPIIANAGFGHSAPVFTFPIGGTVKISASGTDASIEILKH